METMKLLRHVHIAHKKHLSSANKQVSWNDDGTRHDRGRFDDGFKGIEKAKAVARIALNIADDIVLESFNESKFEVLCHKVINECDGEDSLPQPEFTLRIK